MRKTLAVLLSLLLLVAVFAPCAAADDVIPDGYTPIYDKDDLDNIRLNMNGKYILMNDLTFTDEDYARGGDFYNSGKGWSPIGTETAKFNGTLDGNGHTINNLYINDAGTDYIGLFGYANKLTVKNLTVNGNVTGGNYTAMLCGSCSYGSIVNVAASGNVNGKNWTGMIAGKTTGSLSDSTATGTITGYDCTGGMLGYGESFNNCHFNGNITGGESVGGIVGYYGGKSSYNGLTEGVISGIQNVGGVIGTRHKDKGWEELTITADWLENKTLNRELYQLSHLENRMQVSGTRNTGGIVGSITIYIYFSETTHEGNTIYYHYLNVDSTIVKYCLNRGTVTSTDGCAGGIVGSFSSLESSSYFFGIIKSSIQQCSNTGTVAGSYFGALTSGVGSYFIPDTNRSYYLDTCVENPTNTEGNAKSEDQLRKQSTFENWDFTSVWQIDKNADYKFPTLRGVSDMPSLTEAPCAHENAVLQNASDATCTEDGYTGDLYCPDCDTVLETGEVIGAPGHDYVDHPAQAATCGAVGWNAYQTCSRCDYTSYSEIPATGSHTAGDPVETVVTPATCGAAGRKMITVKCSVCGETLSETTEELPATGAHTETVVNAIEATCGKDGFTGVTYCSVCEKVLSVGTVIPATGEHTGAVVGAIAATCGNDGFTGRTYCTVCNSVLSEGTVISATGEHTETIVGAIPALCGRDGFTGVTYCTVCQKVLNVGTSIPATGEHTEGAIEETVLNSPTCNAAGKKLIVMRCAVCEETLSETTGTIPATGRHTAGAATETVITPATCGAAGEKKITVKCTACGETMSEATGTIPATGRHAAGAPEEQILSAPTCTQSGEKVIVTKCAICGETLSEKSERIPAVAHKDADNDGFCDVCQKEMSRDNTCKWCGDVHPDNIIGRLTGFVHSVLYFFAHLFGTR